MRCLRLELDAFGGRLHRHGHAELTWIERGRGLRWVGDGVEPFAEGDFVLLGGELPHLWATQAPPVPGGCAAVVVQFPLDWASAWPEGRAVEGLLARASRGLAVEGEAREPGIALLSRLAASTGLRRVALLAELLALLAEQPASLRELSTMPAVPGADGRASELRRRRVDRVLNWIEANLGQELRAADAATLAHLSPAAFGRFFLREVGKNFVDYVNDARCSWAALRLAEGDEPVARIAHDCGYRSLSHFAEQFRLRFGDSALRYRQRSRGLTSRPRGRQAACRYRADRAG